MMRALSLAELQHPLEAELIGGDASVAAVTTDSRSVSGGELFVALQGERFDGHDYLADVERAGALAALVSQPVSELQLPQLRVADTQRALGKLGAYNRDLFGGKLVAITGSSGKTSVKNMVQAVLASAGSTLATEGNFNNEIGVPLTLLRLAPEHRYAVVEMGAAQAGDIAWLCELGRPTISLLLNAMPAHLQGFGSVDDVAAAKGEIYDGLRAGDVAIINADQPWAQQWRERAGAARIIDFGIASGAALSARSIAVHGMAGVSFIASTPAGEVPVRLHLPGEHNVANALAAMAVGLACDIPLNDIVAALAQVRPTAGRLAVLPGPGGATLVDDCYNANPGSVRAAIALLAQCDGRRTLVLGAMRELGVDSERWHREIGEAAHSAGLDALWGVGEELRATVDAFGAGGRHFAGREQALEAARAQAWGEQDTLLIKGSRGAGMEFILNALVQRGGDR